MEECWDNNDINDGPLLGSNVGLQYWTDFLKTNIGPILQLYIVGPIMDQL